MNGQNPANAWNELYRQVPEVLDSMKDIGRVISAFNSNIDAVVKLSGRDIEALAEMTDLVSLDNINDRRHSISTPSDLVAGLLLCFTKGMAEEWLVEAPAVTGWITEHIGTGRLQMGGQAGVVANALAVCGVGSVLVHCAGLSREQSRLFLDLENLVTTDSTGHLSKANAIERPDQSMIHWILEFDVEDVVTIGGETYKCPKSNRFIATYDPLNFTMELDQNFVEVASQGQNDAVILSGYHLLSSTLADGSRGTDRVLATREMVARWRTNPDTIIHLELASTQDRAIRKYVADTIARDSDSVGLNERETIDLLEVLDADELARQCNEQLTADNLFRGIRHIFQTLNIPRVQLHMFGLYITIQTPDFRISPLAERLGMQLAAVIAATKAGTGAINDQTTLLWAMDMPVSDVGMRELATLRTEIGADYNFLQTGIARTAAFDVIAVPTILIPKPVTLVGMGDTISSISLIGALGARE